MISITVHTKASFLLIHANKRTTNSNVLPRFTERSENQSKNKVKTGSQLLIGCGHKGLFGSGNLRYEAMSWREFEIVFSFFLMNENHSWRNLLKPE